MLVQREPFLAHQLYWLFTAFFTGALFCCFREKINLTKTYFLLSLLFFIVLSFFKFHFVFIEFIKIFVFAYILFYLSRYPSGVIRRYNKLGDYSYGLYIWSFPIQQLLIFADDSITPRTLLIKSFTLTLIVAVLSWHIIESPFLKLNNYLHLKDWRAQLQRLGLSD